ncbi:MAG: S41 family peptidase [Bacillota bacterium]|jgi:carboxyl-terminal processing protease
MPRVLKTILLVVLVAFVSSMGTAYYFRTHGYEVIFPELEGFDLPKMVKVVNAVKSHFVTEVEPGAMLEGALKGLVGYLGDPYSEYLDTEGYQQLNEDTTGTFSGIGVHVGVKHGYVTVIAPVKGSPADEAGLRAGDQILSVDGKDITQATLEEAVRLIRGPEGTPVDLQVTRDGQILHFSIVRDNVKLASVEWEMVGDDIGYLRIINFTEDTMESVTKAVREMENRGAQGLLLDLRSNPGGLLQEAIAIAPIFVPEGPIVEIAGKDGSHEQVTSSSDGYRHPIVVLVNGGSASASEILAGAIRDRGVGTLVGAKTFGKGSIQSIISLRDGTGLKLTTARYLTPSGQVIHGEGIEPHIQIELEEGETASSPSNGPDSQVKKALEVLRERMMASAA